MKKTLEQNLDFKFAVDFLWTKVEKETKLLYACGKVLKKGVQKIIDDFSEKQNDILNKYAATGEHGEILKDAEGRHILSRENEAKSKKELKELYEREKGVEYEVEPYIATSLEGHDLSQSQMEVLDGFVLELENQ